ncbi:ABC transporter substrate-binding protein [Paenibacillus shunpengii]|uniref:ABC transporter substrate-binding protein n=1 Tax=Paenibacillus shunpengii TaxID=2054424 RepID=A0ABW5SN83_9BACL
MFMKLFKPGIFTLLSVFVLLTGCGVNGNDNKQAATVEGEYEVVMAYPVFGDVSDVSSVETAMSELARQKIGATVKLIPITGSNYSNQMNLMLAGSEKLDLVYTSVWMGFETQASRGQLIPMDELLSTHGAKILNEVPSYGLEAGQIQGETYGIPSLKGWALTPSFVIATEIIKELNINSSGIRTWTDLTSVLQKLKEVKPEMIPMASYNTSEAPGTAMMYFDPLGLTAGVLPFEGEGYQLLQAEETELYNETVNLMRSWYQQGYFSKDIATTQETAATLVKNGKAASYIRNINDCYSESVPAGTELTCIPMEEPYMTRNSISSNMISISRNSEQPEKAMQFMELLYTDSEMMNLFVNGIEGVHYVKQGDQIALPEGKDSTGYASNPSLIGNNFLTYVWSGNDPDMWTAVQKTNGAAVKSRAMGFSFDISGVKNEITAVSNVDNQYSTGFMTGISDPALIPEYVSKLKAAGIERIIQEKQKQMDEWLLTNKKD